MLRLTKNVYFCDSHAPKFKEIQEMKYVLSTNSNLFHFFPKQTCIEIKSITSIPENDNILCLESVNVDYIIYFLIIKTVSDISQIDKILNKLNRFRMRLYNGVTDVKELHSFKKFKSQNEYKENSLKDIPKEKIDMDTVLHYVSNDGMQLQYAGYYRKMFQVVLESVSNNPLAELCCYQDVYESKEYKELDHNHTLYSIYVLSNYKFIRRLGNGSFGQVWLVKDRYNKHFAMKYDMSPSVHPGILPASMNEVTAMARCKHRNIVSFENVLPDCRTGSLYLFMPVADNNLQSIIGTSTIKQKLTWALDIFCGAEYLHQNQLIHMDIKPENVLLFKEENGDYVAKLSDLGLADRDYGIKTKDMEKFTASFRPPEFMFGKSSYTFRVDIWSIGVTLINMFFHSLPWENKDGSNRHQVEFFTPLNYMSRFMGNLTKSWAAKYVDDSLEERYKPVIDMEEKKTTNEDMMRMIFSIGERNLIEQMKNPRSNVNIFMEMYGKELFWDIIDLIRQCVVFDPVKRIQYSEVLKHPVFNKYEWTKLSNGKRAKNITMLTQYSKIEKRQLNLVEYNQVFLEPILEKFFSFIVFKIPNPYARLLSRCIWTKVKDLVEDTELILLYQIACIDIAFKMMFANLVHTRDSYDEIYYLNILISMLKKNDINVDIMNMYFPKYRSIHLKETFRAALFRIEYFIGSSFNWKLE
jgi:serine/threonine protein kinase